MYKRGTGVRKDKLEAMKWLRLAAEAGHTKAQFTLGWMYYGEEVLTNKLEAIKWFGEAEKGGYLRAARVLGRMYLYGDGVEEDRLKAFKYFKDLLKSDKIPPPSTSMRLIFFTTLETESLSS